jgi:acyl-[acyl-carrier-protein] desaturase
VPATTRETVYQLYLEYLETAETKRNWSIFNDIPWDQLDASKATETDAQCVEIYCSEEMYVPDYSSNALELVRPMFGMAWFQARWASEESKHGLVFREYLLRSGLRTQTEFESLETGIFAKSWHLPFGTARRMTCYGAIQESATYLAYKQRKDLAQSAGDRVLEAIYFCVARDEAAHGGFYRSIVGLEMAQDREGTIADLAFVLAHFKMPGDGLIPDYRQRLQSSGAGITPRAFIERVIWPLLATLEITRAEMKIALRKAALPQL